MVLCSSSGGGGGGSSSGSSSSSNSSSSSSSSSSSIAIIIAMFVDSNIIAIIINVDINVDINYIVKILISPQGVQTLGFQKLVFHLRLPKNSPICGLCVLQSMRDVSGETLIVEIWVLHT